MMRIPDIFKKKINYKEKYEFEKARADAAERELINLAGELQETLNGFSIFRGGQRKKSEMEMLYKYNKK